MGRGLVLPRRWRNGTLVSEHPNSPLEPNAAGGAGGGAAGGTYGLTPPPPLTRAHKTLGDVDVQDPQPDGARKLKPDAPTEETCGGAQS